MSPPTCPMRGAEGTRATALRSGPIGSLLGSRREAARFSWYVSQPQAAPPPPVLRHLLLGCKAKVTLKPC